MYTTYRGQKVKLTVEFARRRIGSPARITPNTLLEDSSYSFFHQIIVMYGILKVENLDKIREKAKAPLTKEYEKIKDEFKKINNIYQYITKEDFDQLEKVYIKSLKLVDYNLNQYKERIRALQYCRYRILHKQQDHKDIPDYELAIVKNDSKRDVLELVNPQNERQDIVDFVKKAEQNCFEPYRMFKICSCAIMDDKKLTESKVNKIIELKNENINIDDLYITIILDDHLI